MGYPSVSTGRARTTRPGLDADAANSQQASSSADAIATHTIDIIDTDTDTQSGAVEAAAAHEDSRNSNALSDAMIHRNRKGSGWNSLDIPVQDLQAALAPALSSPAVRAGLLNPIGTPADEGPSRRSRYEAAATMAISRQSMDDYVREMALLGERGKSTTAQSPVRPPALDDVDLWADTAPLPMLQQNRGRTLAGIAAILLFMLAAAWLVAREWPTDFTPSVRALVSER